MVALPSDQEAITGALKINTTWYRFFRRVLGPITDFALTLLDDADAATARATLEVANDGYGYGCTLSNNSTDATNDIDITAGAWADSTNTVIMRPSAQTKRLDADWAAGTGNGFRNSGAAIANTTYHIYVVAKALGADPDYYAHTSTTVATVITALQAETGGSSYIYARRIGSIIRSGAAIVLFTQNDDEFLRDTPVADINTTNPGTAAVTATLSVPTGIVVDAIISGTIIDPTTAAGTPTGALFTALAQANTAPNAAGPMDLYVPVGTVGDAQANSVWKTVRTNTSAQIRYRQTNAAADVIARITTMGWIDRRGRLA